MARLPDVLGRSSAVRARRIGAGAGDGPYDALPAIGSHLPAVSLRLLLALLGLGVCAAELSWSSWWFVVAIVMILATAVRPASPAPWALVALLVLHQIGVQPGVTWRFGVLLAGVHALCVLTALAATLPVRARLQLFVLAAPLRRFVTIQVPVQTLAAVVLWGMTGGRRPDLPPVGAVAGVALIAVAVFVILRTVTDDPS
jgi:hypothetical protein